MSEPEGVELPNPVVCADYAFKSTNQNPKASLAWSQLGLLMTELPHTVSAHEVAMAAGEYLADPSSETHEVLALAVARYQQT